jgi:actin-related protein
MGGGSLSNDTSPRIAARKTPAPLGVAAGAVQAASQIFEQMGYAQRKLGGSAALPAAWTSSRRTSPVATPREDFANALPEEEDSSSDGSGPLPPPSATVTKLQLKGVVASVGPKTPTSSRSTGSNGAAGESSAPGEAGGDDSTGTESHSRFDVEELQELKRRLQLRKEKAETPRIKVHAIEMITDDGDSDGDSDSADDAAPVDGARRNKSKEKRRPKDRPKSKSSSSSSSKNVLSLRRRKKGGEDAGEPLTSTTSAPTSTVPPPPPADDSPRKSTSTRDRPSSSSSREAASRSRKVRTLPRNARAAVANDGSDDDDDDDDGAGEAALDASPPAKRDSNDDDVWQRLIAAEKEKQLRRERRKKAEQASNPSALDDEDGMPLVDESNKSGSIRRKDKRRSKTQREPDAPSFDQVFAAVEDGSPAESPRPTPAAAATEVVDEFGAFFQEEPEAARGVQFSEDTKADSGSTTSIQTRARSRSVTERIGIAKLGLQPVTLGAIKEKSKIKADAEAGDVAAIAAAAAAATAASDAVALGAPKPAAAGAVAAVAAAAAAAPTATNASGKQPSDRPKVCQLCVARKAETPGKVAARVVTPDGVELFLCKPCTLEYQSRDGGPLPMPSAAATAGMNRAPPNPAALAAVAALSASAPNTTASRLSASAVAAATPPPPPAAAAAVAAVAASPLATTTTAADSDGEGPLGKNRFSFTRLKTRLSGRYKLQRDAEGNVITVDRVAGVTGSSSGGESSPDLARRGSGASAALPSAPLGRNSRRNDDDGSEDVVVDPASSDRLRRELAAVQTRHAIGFDIGRRTDDIVVVIDPGSATTKVGFSGEAAPRAVMPTWVRYMEAVKRVPAGMFGQPVIPIAEGTLPDRPGFIGEDPSVPKLRSNWKHPVERGVVRDWDEMEKILEYSFDFELKADPEDHPVIMTDGSPLSDRLQRERAVQIMFETFNVPSTYLALQSAMSLLACGQLTGLVVTIGDGVTCAVPIYEGFPMRHSIHTLDRAGADLTTHMVDLVNDAMQATDDWAKLAPGETEQLLFDSTSHSDRYQFEQLKRKYCYVARQSVVAEEKLASESRYKYEKQWTTLDGRRLPLLHERYLACEPLFAPSRIGGAEMHWLDETGTSTERRHVNCEGIHRLAYASVRKCDKSVRKTLLQNVYLAGGSSRIDGLTERMTEELKSLLVGTHLAKAKVNVSGGTASDEYSEWVGASMFASLSAFASTAISKDEYLEVGPTVVHRRCL